MFLNSLNSHFLFTAFDDVVLLVSPPFAKLYSLCSFCMGYRKELVLLAIKILTRDWNLEEKNGSSHQSNILFTLERKHKQKSEICVLAAQNFYATLLYQYNDSRGKGLSGGKIKRVHSIQRYMNLTHTGIGMLTHEHAIHMHAYTYKRLPNGAKQHMMLNQNQLDIKSAGFDCIDFIPSLNE